MLIICEDTEVSPLVEKFLIDEGYGTPDISRIDSTAKGELKGDWKEVKQQLFNIDDYPAPKIIISVLMLREGFDVNNICVIVPLRASTSQILLEQTLGRGLRLMWRGKDYEDIKRETRELVMIKKKAPNSYIDILNIIEHPRFLEFYDDLIKDNLVGAVVEEMTRDSVVGDLIKVGLKADYQQYDLFWIEILHDSVEEIKPLNIKTEELEPLQSFSLATLQGIFARDGEKFISQEITAKTQFGEYNVNANLFNAVSYSEYLRKLYEKVVSRMDFAANRSIKKYPIMQMDGAKIVALMDDYIKTRLFNQPFEPAQNNNWKILFAHSAVATQHIIEQISKAVFKAQQQINVVDAVIEQFFFSTEVPELKMREKYSLPLQKAIYERTGYPSNKGTLECEFLQYLDRDSDVERFIKIDENQHPFAKISYIRSDGLLSSYHPDFMVCTKKYIYIIETKGNDRIDDPNVHRKQRATIEWCDKINTLPADKRMQRLWVYVLLSEGVFYAYAERGASIDDICSIAKVQKPKENLFE
jgi:type III restriction enzyme